MNLPRLKEGMMIEMRGMGGTGCGADVGESHGHPDLPEGGGGKWFVERALTTEAQRTQRTKDEIRRMKDECAVWFILHPSAFIL
jgi:hypothetical protein